MAYLDSDESPGCGRESANRPVGKPLGELFPSASFPTHEIHEVWDRRLLARDIMLILLKSDDGEPWQTWPQAVDAFCIAQSSVLLADALLAELAKERKEPAPPSAALALIERLVAQAGGNPAASVYDEAWAFLKAHKPKEGA